MTDNLVHDSSGKSQHPARHTLSGKRVEGPTAMHTAYGLSILYALQRKHPIFQGVKRKKRPHARN